MKSIHSDLSVPSVIAKIGYCLNPQKSIYTIRDFSGFHQKANGGSLCHLDTVKAIHSRKNPKDAVVLLGAHLNRGGKPFGYVTHSILVDSNNNIIADSNKSSQIEGEYKQGKGYFFKGTNDMLYNELLHLPVSKLIDLTQRSNEMIELQETAKVEPTVLTAFLKTMYLILAYSIAPIEAKKPFKLPADILTDAKGWEDGCFKFAAQFGIRKVLITRMLKAVKAGAPWTEDIDADLTLLGKDIWASRAKTSKDVSIPSDQFKMINDLASVFKSNAQGAMARCEKTVALLRDPRLSKLFSLEETNATTGQEQRELFEAMEKLTKKHLGEAKTKLSTEEIEHLKAVKPEVLKEYNKLKTAAKKVFDNFVRSFVRNSGKEYIPYKDLIDACKKEKIAYHEVKDFVGNIDQEGNFRTTKGLIIQSPGNATAVIMNPKYDAENDKGYVYRAVLPNGNITSGLYTLNHVAGGRVEKKEKGVSDLQENYKKIRNKWLADLSSHTFSRNKIMAAEVEIIFSFGAREGNPKNGTIDRETGERIPTYGITTLLVKHVIPHEGGYRIMYDGKKLSPLDYVIKPNTSVNKKIIAVITKELQDKKPDDPLWTDEKGKVIPSQYVAQKYFKSLGAGSATLHKVRHLLGTDIAKKILAESPLKKGVSQSEAESWYKESLKKVGVALGHHSGNNITSSTAIKSYIDPNMQKKFFSDLGLKIPAWLQVKGKGGLTSSVRFSTIV